jgi:hypothetical protein
MRSILDSMLEPRPDTADFSFLLQAIDICISYDKERRKEYGANRET